MKPGFQTSELWLCVGAIGVQILHKQFGLTVTSEAVISAIAGLYTLGRSALKIKALKP